MAVSSCHTRRSKSVPAGASGSSKTRRRAAKYSASWRRRAGSGGASGSRRAPGWWRARISAAHCGTGPGSPEPAASWSSRTSEPPQATASTKAVGAAKRSKTAGAASMAGVVGRAGVAGMEVIAGTAGQVAAAVIVAAAVSCRIPPLVTATGQAMELDPLLKFMTEKGASDLHLKPTRPPLLRINGKLLPLDATPLRSDELSEMLRGILTPAQKARLEEKLSVDIGYGVQGLARFRGNIYVQRGYHAAVFRRIPYQIKTLDELELPPVMFEFCELPMGLVLVTGPTGSGKSTSLAAMVRHISIHRPVHIITIEDPMEFLFSDDVASISQRELGTDTMSFTEALRNAMRQDPDVIMVGEMRDRETVSTVMTAAETGHLVFSTLHTNSAPQTVDRILDTFPADQQGQIRTQLAQVLKGVVSMKLVERQDRKGRVAALEIMRASPKICKLIEEGETGQLHEELESSVGYYRMQSLNQCLLSLLVHGTISYQEAMRQSADPE